jgi:hypothetical protein
LSGASAGAQAGAGARRHDVFASCKIKTANGVRATPVAKRTARLTDFGAGATLWAKHVVFLSPSHRVIGALTFSRILKNSFSG